MHLASDPVAFRVVSGPGVVQGTHNGDPRNHQADSAQNATAYHGLVRAVIRVTSTAARFQRERRLLAQIDRHGPMAAGSSQEAVEPIVVEASSPGFDSVQISIPVSTDLEADGVMAAAAAAAGKPVDFFGSSSTSVQMPRQLV